MPEKPACHYRLSNEASEFIHEMAVAFGLSDAGAIEVLCRIAKSQRMIERMLRTGIDLDEFKRKMGRPPRGKK